MKNSIEFFLNTHTEWSLSRQDLVITLTRELVELCIPPYLPHIQLYTIDLAGLVYLL